MHGPSERARAMAVYVTGAVIGTGGGLIIGGLLGEILGWRLTFLALGVPGILVGILVFVSVKEPKRGRFDATKETESQASDITATLVSLKTNRVYVTVSVSYAMLTMVGYAMALWLAPIMLRNFDVSLGNVGLYLGLTYFAGGTPGPILGGYLTDYMVELDHRWRAWIPAVFILMSVFIFGLCLSAESLEAFLGYFALSYALFMIPQGASLSILQTSVNAGERALGTSIALLANNLVGLAFGPLIIGLLSDSLSLEYGAKSLNYALLIVCSAAALIAAIGYQWTALAMSSDSSSDTGLNDPRQKL